jgi:hypothetical protein
MPVLVYVAEGTAVDSNFIHFGAYGLILAATTAVLLWMGRQVLSGALSNLGAKSVDSLASRAPSGRLKGGRLRRYRRAVQRNFASHPIGFAGSAAIDIQSVYVPLRSEVDGKREDVYARIRNEGRSVVIGAAGAGKTLLLKNSMLIWANSAAGDLGRHKDRRVPVLVELHRCNTSESDLLELVMEELARNQVRRPKSFVDKTLREGRLRLLLDGFDEVGKERQKSVIIMLRDFAQTYPECQIVVTCRDAVYRGQLSPAFEHVVTIADFDDAGIRQLLGNWPGMNRADVDRLTHTLRCNPSLMYLARSPLLLTMIAYLFVNAFSKTGRTLPSSRVKFYETAITHLLDRDHDLGRSSSLSCYDVGDKLSVLQRIALVLQDTPPGVDDRKAISHAQAIAVTRDVLPDINLDPANTKFLLDEIVDRSQLVMPLNRSRTQYAFRHLTLQEYLAARELADCPDQLMERYRNDPDSWREVVKLWCGGIRSCTSVVQEVMGFGSIRDQALAIECLIDAKLIDEVFADQVISYFASFLGKEDSETNLISSAFGALAASEGPRGQRVLQLLISKSGPEQPDRIARRAALVALSESGRLEAAEALAPIATADWDARSALRGMGELAIPVLVKRAHSGDLQALDDLGFIRTPAAAEALADLLWLDERVAVRAAWWLAELLMNPDVEEGLRSAQININSNAQSLDWIWRPFTHAGVQGDVLALIAGRVGYLICSGPDALVPDTVDEIDPRLAVPILGIEIGRLFSSGSLDLDQMLSKNARMLAAVKYTHSQLSLDDVEKYFNAQSRKAEPSIEADEIAESILSGIPLDAAHRALLDRLRWPIRAQLLGVTFTPRMGKVQQRDWLQVRRQSKSANPIWGLLVGTCVGAAIAAIAFAAYWQVETIKGASSFGPWWSSALALALLVGSCFLVAAGISQGDGGEVMGVPGVFIFLVVTLGDSVESYSVLSGWIGSICTLAIFVGIAFCIISLGMLAVKRSHQFDNPLRRCLHAGGQSFADRTSVIAEDTGKWQGSPDMSAVGDHEHR